MARIIFGIQLMKPLFILLYPFQSLTTGHDVTFVLPICYISESYNHKKKTFTYTPLNGILLGCKLSTGSRPHGKHLAVWMDTLKNTMQGKSIYVKQIFI